MKHRYSAARAVCLVLVCLLFLAGCGQKEAASAAQNTPAEAEKIIDVYVIAGQSNAAGFTMNPEDTASFTTNVYYYAFGGPGANQIEHEFGTKVAYGKGSRGPEYFGPEIGMAKIIDKSGRTNEAIIFKYAWGGTYLYDKNGDGFCWQGQLYDSWKADLTAMVAHYKDLGYTVHLMGTFWMQGEADSEQEVYKDAYEDNLKALIRRMRGDYQALGMTNAGAPFVIGKIANNYPTPYVMDIRAIQVRVASELADENVVAINTAEAGRAGGDDYHFGTEDMLTVGQRAARAILDHNDAGE